MPGRPDEGIEDLDPEVAAYVSAFRDEEVPSAATHADTWAAIEGRVAPRSRVVWIAGGLLAAAAAVVLVLWGRGLDLDEQARRSDPQAPYEAGHADAGRRAEPGGVATPRSEPTGLGARQEPPPELAVDTDPDPAEPQTAGADSGGPEKRDGAGRRRHDGKRRPKPEAVIPDEPPVGPSALAEETTLFKSIGRALADGRNSDALRMIKQHAARFPRGVFRHERTVAKARALCALGRKDSARELADAFLAQHPRSHLAPRMRGVCR